MDIFSKADRYRLMSLIHSVAKPDKVPALHDDAEVVVSWERWEEIRLRKRGA